MRDTTTHNGKPCFWDGTSLKYSNGECVSCFKHRQGCSAGRVLHATDGRKTRKEAEAKMHFETENI
jgi:hypothetical protein